MPERRSVCCHRTQDADLVTASTGRCIPFRTCCAWFNRTQHCVLIGQAEEAHWLPANITFSFLWGKQHRYGLFVLFGLGQPLPESPSRTDGALPGLMSTRINPSFDLTRDPKLQIESTHSCLTRFGTSRRNGSTQQPTRISAFTANRDLATDLSCIHKSPESDTSKFVLAKPKPIDPNDRWGRRRIQEPGTWIHKSQVETLLFGPPTGLLG